MKVFNLPNLEYDCTKTHTAELRAFRYKKGDIVFGTRDKITLKARCQYVFNCKSDYAIPEEYSFKPVIMQCAYSNGIRVNGCQYRNLELFSVCITNTKMHDINLGKYYPLFNVKVYENNLSKIIDANLIHLNDDDDELFMNLDM